MHPTEERQTDPAARRAELLSLLGDLPDLNRPITAELVREEARAGYHLEVLTLDLNGIEPVPAYFVKPNAGGGPFPTVIYNHSHGGAYHIGKDELLNGREYLQSPPYAEALTAQGYAALCIDAWCFGERHDLPELELVKLMLWRGQVLWGSDGLRQPARGGLRHLRPTWTPRAWRRSACRWAARWRGTWRAGPAHQGVRRYLLPDRLPGADRRRGLGGHGIYYYVPGLLKHFTTAEINALIVPRPHLGWRAT